MQSATQDHYTPGWRALIFLADLHLFLLLVTSPQFSFGVAGGRAGMANQLIFLESPDFFQAQHAAQVGPIVLGLLWSF